MSKSAKPEVDNDREAILPLTRHDDGTLGVRMPERDIHAILADIEAEFLHFPDAATAKARALLVELRRAL